MAKDKFFNDYQLFGNFVNIMIGKKIYKSIFNHRTKSYSFLSFKVEDFPGLTKERYTFKANKGHNLVGYLYQYPNNEKHSVMVFAHGYGGGGHRTYLNLIDYFVRQGYYVFAYDATAADESEGDGIYSFTQGIHDADKAISLVEKMKQLKNLPLILCGHSWGAYSMSNVLHLHKKAKCLISFSGFNNATSIFHANGEIYGQDYGEETIKIIDKVELFISNNDSKLTAVDSFKNSLAQIIIVHSKDDRTVPPQAGIEIYENEFKNDDRFTFIKLENKGHGTVYYSTEGKTWFDNAWKLFNSQIKVNKIKDFEEKNKLGEQIFEHSKMLNLLNEQLLDQIIRIIK